MSPEAELGGYAEVRASYQVGVEGTPWNLVERVRPSFEISPAPRVTAEAVIEAALVQGRVTEDEAVELLMASELGGLIEQAGCAPEAAPRYDEVSDYLSVERLHVDFNLPGADVTIGRQAVNWGSALVFHPTDIQPEVLVTEPWRERRGLDAVKADVPMGEHSFVGVVALPDDLSPLYADDPELPLAVAGKLTLRGFGTDAAAVVHARTDGEWFVGADLRGTLGAGWWVEGGWHGLDGAPEVVAGLDYSFPWLDMFYVAGEYRYDGTGSLPEDYDYTERGGVGTLSLDCAFLPPVEPGTRSTLGVHYVNAVVRVGFLDDVSLGGAVIYNVLDGTGLAAPSASVNVGPRVAVNLGAQVPFGEDGEFRPAARDLVYGTGDYTVDLSGLLPDATVNGWVRYSF